MVETLLNNRPRPTAVLLDMGGVLLESGDSFDEATIPLAFPDGLPPDTPVDWFLGLSQALITNFVKTPPPRPAVDSRPVIAQWLEQRAIEPTPETVDYWHRVLAHWEVRPLYPFVPDALERLYQNGIRLGVVSNNLLPGEHHRDLFRQGGILDLFEVVVFSAEVGINKPHPSIFEHALDRMNLEPHQAWYVGDKPHRDVCGANAVGLTSVLVDSAHHHLCSSAPDHEPDLRVRDLADLADHLSA